MATSSFGKYSTTVTLALIFILSATVSTYAAEERLDHVLRVQMTVEYDGEITEIDDMIYCGAREKGTLFRRPVSQVLPTRYRVTERLHDGSAVTLELSWKVCSFKQSQWRSHKTPETEYKVPDGYTPMMNWRDSWDPKDLTREIRFHSENALYDDDAFVRIVKPVEFSVPEHPPSDELIAQVFREDDWYSSREWPDMGLPYPVLVRIPKSEWRNVAKYERLAALKSSRREPPDMDLAVAYLEDKASTSGGLTYLFPEDGVPEELKSAIWEYFFYHRPYSRQQREDGIPRFDHDDFGWTGSANPVLPRRTNFIEPMLCDTDHILRPVPRFNGTVFRLLMTESCRERLEGDRRPYILEIDGQLIHRVRKGVKDHIHREGIQRYLNTSGDQMFAIEHDGLAGEVAGGPLQTLFFDSRTNEILLITR